MMTVVFIGLIVIGFLIIYPLVPRYFAETKKFWVTVGIILIHIGLYGLLWIYLPGVVFISLLLFEAGLFAVWDPFRLCPPPQKRLVNTAGFTTAAAGVIISLSLFTSFPLWLWALPAILALLPYVVPPLAKQGKPILALSITLVIVYLGVIGVKIYRLFLPAGETVAVETKRETAIEPTKEPAGPAPTVFPAPEPPGPVTRAIQGIDKRIQELEEENARLKMELETLRNENLKLRESMTGRGDS